MSRPNDLSIGRLILDGVAVSDRKRLKVAIERELARLLATPEMRPALIANGPPERLPGGTLRVAPGPGDAALATAIAQAIHAAIAVPPVPSAARLPLPHRVEGRGEGAGATRSPQP